MNIAQQFINSYESEDFKNNYSFSLLETFGNEEYTIIQRIYDLFNLQNYETEKYLSNYKKLDKDQCKKVYDFVYDNLEEFTTDFKGYYVGFTSLDSVSFGEQEEQLTGLYNNNTGKNYTLPYLKKVCEANDFYVSDEYAYYNLDGGLHIDLLNDIELLNNFIKTLN